MIKMKIYLISDENGPLEAYFDEKEANKEYKDYLHRGQQGMSFYLTAIDINCRKRTIIVP